MDDLENAQQDWKVLSLPFAVTLPMQNFQTTTMPLPNYNLDY